MDIHSQMQLAEQGRKRSGKRLLGFIYPAAVPPSNPQIALGQNWFDLADNVYVRS